MAGRLRGKTGIVTGGARGIGAASAAAFAREGAAVAVWDINEAAARSTVDRITRDGGRAIFCRSDVTSPAEIDVAIVRTVRECGPPAILMNNAAAVIVGGVEELTEEQWDRQFAINVKSVFLVSRVVLPHMRSAGGGSIINVSSESAFVGFPMHPAYCASKAAVVHLSRSMAVRYAPEKIRVNALCPGTIDTEMYREFLRGCADPKAVESEIHRLHPLGVGTPEDIAWAAVYLASDESRYMTGAPFMIDGGITSV